MRYRTGLWLSLVVFTIHNVEEYLTMPGFFATHGSEIPAFARRVARPIVGDLFVTVVAMLTVVAVGMVVAGVRGAPRSPGTFVALVWVSGGLFVNGVHHAALSAIFRDYTPGVASSVLLLIPSAAWLYRQALTERLIVRAQIWWSLLASVLLMGPVIVLGRSAGEWLLGR